MKSRVVLLSSAAMVAASSVAHANGRYPSAGQLLVDPNDPQHIVVSATFGVLDSRDGGKSFGWLCEAAIGTSGQQDLMLAITGNSATVVAMYNGMARTMDGCSYRSAPELADKSMVDLAPSKSSPHRLVAFWLQYSGTFSSQIVRSEDDGQTWAPVSEVFPPEIYPVTVDIAPSVASRVYLSARGDKTKNFGSMLMRSEDGGATFVASTDIPDTEEHRLAYIAAVHPSDPDRVYFRILDAAATVIQMTTDGGRTFQKIFTGTGQLLGFAISPDGSRIAVGGPDDGIWIGSSDGTGLERQSDVGATCLTWTSDALYACADYKIAGFSIGRSTDSAKTFAPLFRFDALCGRAACGKDNTARCGEEWDLVAPAIGATCPADAGTDDDASGGTSREGGATGGAGGAAGSGNAGGTVNTGGTAGTATPSDDSSGCGCALARERSTRKAAGWGAIVGLLAVISRWRSRRDEGSQ